MTQTKGQKLQLQRMRTAKEDFFNEIDVLTSEEEQRIESFGNSLEDYLKEGQVFSVIDQKAFIPSFSIRS